MVAVGYVIARLLAPFVIDHMAIYVVDFQETPSLFALALGLLFGVLAASLGYSPGMGAFIIGLSIRGRQARFLSERVATY